MRCARSRRRPWQSKSERIHADPGLADGFGRAAWGRHRPSHRGVSSSHSGWNAIMPRAMKIVIGVLIVAVLIGLVVFRSLHRRMQRLADRSLPTKKRGMRFWLRRFPRRPT